MKPLTCHGSVRRTSLPSHVWNMLKCFDLLAPRRGQRGRDHHRLNRINTIISSERRPLHRIIRPSKSFLLNIQDRHISTQGNTFVNLQNSSSMSSDLSSVSSDFSNSSPSQLQNLSSLSSDLSSLSSDFSHSSPSQLQNLSSLSSDLSSVSTDSSDSSPSHSGPSNGSTSKLLLCCLNARSLRNKSAAFIDLLSENKADLFAVNETWLTHNDTTALAELSVPGYKLLHCPRSNLRGGGTALFFRDCLDVTRVNSSEESSFEFSEWLVSTPTVRLRVIIVYRPPYSHTHPVTISTFITEFANLLESVVLLNEQLLICGDFNIHVNASNDDNAIKFKDLLESMSLVQHVTEPTHEHGNTLDLIITRSSDGIIAAPPQVGTLFSDHAVVTCHLTTERPKSTAKQIIYRKLKSIDMNHFIDDIGTSLLCLNPPEDLDALVNCYNSTLSSVLNQHAPLQSRSIPIRSRAPWFNDNIKNGKREKRKAERRWRSSRKDSDLSLFKSKRNRMLVLINNARQEYYSNLVAENCHNQAKLFRVSKTLLNLQADNMLPPHDNASSLAHEMGEYFVHKISTIRSKLDSHCPSSFTPPPMPTKCYNGIGLSQFDCLSDDYVKELIASSNINCCPLDPLPSSLLSACVDTLLPIITKMVNLSLQSGVFAMTWKNALVRPLLKKPGLDHTILKNFRPISNLQFVSKLTEKAVAKQITEHMSTHGLFPSLQSAYRIYHSTETALLKVKNDLLLNMNNGHVTILVLLDLSAAFDTVDHDLLLQKLQSVIGIQGTALSWFQSYLGERSQQISINGTLSRKFHLQCGIPQGSCLGPLLFTIYSSKLFEILKHHLPTAHAWMILSFTYLSALPSAPTKQMPSWLLRPVFVTLGNGCLKIS